MPGLGLVQVPELGLGLVLEPELVQVLVLELVPEPELVLGPRKQQLSH